MTGSEDLDPLSALWRTDDAAPSPAGWERRRRRWRWQMRVTWLAEGLVTLGLAIGTTLAADDGWTLREALLWGHAWLLWGVVTAFALWNRRGLWRLHAASPEEFLEQEALRCRRGLRTVVFVRVVVVVEVVVLAVFLLVLRESSRTSWITLALVALVYLGWAGLFAARARRRLRAVERTRAELAENGGQARLSRTRPSSRDGSIGDRRRL